MSKPNMNDTLDRLLAIDNERQRSEREPPNWTPLETVANDVIALLSNAERMGVHDAHP